MCPLQGRRERTQRALRGSTSSWVEIEGTCVSKNFGKTIRLQFQKRQEWIREVKRERLQGIAEGANSAPRLASSSAASFPGRNECPGTHCSQIEHEERSRRRQFLPDLLKRKDGGEGRVARTERESDRRRRREEKWQARWCCRDHQEHAEWSRLQRKNLNILGLPKRKE